MFTAWQWVLFIGAGMLWWLAVYLVSRNARVKIAWVLGLFLASLSIYLAGDTISREIPSYGLNSLVWRGSSWSYLFPIGLLFHFGVIVSKRSDLLINKVLVVTFYAISIFYSFASIFTNLMIRYDIVPQYLPGYGFANPRGPLFSSIANVVIALSGFSLWNYLAAWRAEKGTKEGLRYVLPALTSILYLIAGPLLVYIYYLPDASQPWVIAWTPILLVLPLLPALIAILFFKLVSEVDSIFNIKEFLYLSVAMFLINAVNGTIFVSFAPQLGEAGYIWMALFMFITVFTHGFYDWLTTFVRDLLYSAGRGFSIITDAEVADLVRSFHEPEKLETNTLLKFNAVKQRADGGRLVDAAQQLAREAIEYFKQPDFPRRNKQNLKYQLLKMVMLDDADEGQILWELGFDGYPIKIMSGEDNTRRPLFKVESMSDYTATSRNAFIALKKGAIHDLGWRLSYLEKLATNQRK